MLTASPGRPSAARSREVEPPAATGGSTSRLLAAIGRPGDAVSMDKCHYSRTDPSDPLTLKELCGLIRRGMHFTHSTPGRQ